MKRPEKFMPYQLGMWLSEYGRSLCHVCQVLPLRPTTPHLNTVPNPQFTQDNSIKYQKNSSRSLFYRGLLCEQCHADNNWLPKPFIINLNDSNVHNAHVNARENVLSVQAASPYSSMIRKAIVAFKYHEDLTALPLLVYALRQLPRPLNCHEGNSVIVPMPTTKPRLIKRGFDPVTILCRYLSKHWQIPVAFDFISRVDNASSQQGLTREERLENIKDAFKLSHPYPAENTLLFDDVATTGSSLKALAKCVNNVNYPTHLSAYAIAHGNHV